VQVTFVSKFVQVTSASAT